MSTTSKLNDMTAVRDAIVEGYLETGKAMDVPQIATRLQWSDSKVRRVISDAAGAVNGTYAKQETRESYSRSYRMMQSGSHKAWTYLPTLQHLRELIRDLRIEFNVLALSERKERR